MLIGENATGTQHPRIMQAEEDSLPFDKIIEISMPKEVSDRVEIFKIHSRNRPMGDLNLTELGELTDGFSGADIAAICDEAVISAIRDFVAKLSESEAADIEHAEEQDVTGHMKGAIVNLDHFKRAIEKIRSTKQRLKQTQIRTDQPATEYF